MVRSVSSLALVGLQQEMVVVQGLPLNEPHIILSQILSMLISDFKAQGLKSIPTPFGLVSLFNGISTFVGYLMPKQFS